MSYKVYRRWIGLLSAFVTILICLYYISMGQPSSPKEMRTLKEFKSAIKDNINKNKHSKIQEKNKHLSSSNIKNCDSNSCYILEVQQTNITTGDEFGKFDFQPEWIKTKEYWDKTFEDRFIKQQTDKKRPALKVFIVPHSHNDPGWLNTYLNYFQSESRQILNFVINKMIEYKDMTFIWSEISFLQLWWDQAHPTKRRALKKLVDSGRFEITTGGWVMTDEANVHLYAMIDQLIEGHQWVKTNLNTTPTVGWSIDPFGHGATVPYLLSASDFEGTIIQRIHYAWKQWLAKNQNGDFIWKPFWKSSMQEVNNNNKRSILTHNMPFDIYSIKHSCGPHPFICLNFDFRKIPGEYTEYSIKAQFITDENVAEKAELLIDQYSRTASLFPHNVALIPVGDDFRYDYEKEVDQQYVNYKKLIDYINEHKKIFNTEISFGTPKDYFREIKKRIQIKDFPTLKGDFFVYSDIFTEGRPAYWSGYFSTRPFYKILSSELEHNLRSSEILFTFAYNNVRQKKNYNAIKVLEKNYEKIILARRNLGLFQHHDAITGTSKSFVMRDYGIRLFESIQSTVKMQTTSIEMMLQRGKTSFQNNFLLNEFERDSFDKLPRKTAIVLNDNNLNSLLPSETSFIVFNSLAQKRVEVLTVRTNNPNVLIVNENGLPVMVQQINPIWNITEKLSSNAANNNIDRISVSSKQYEILFLAELPPLSLLTFRLIQQNDDKFKNNLATVYCNECSTDNNNNNNNSNTTTNNIKNVVFDIKNIQPGDIQLENNKMRLLFDEKSGFLKSITTRKNFGKSFLCGIKFAAYKSAQFHSGAYLFKTDPEQRDIEKDVLLQYEDNIKIIITSGQLASDVTVIYGPFLAHTVRIFNTHTHLDDAIYIENDIDFEPPPNNRETELFMRLLTEIENGNQLPEFYSDQNGFQFHHRVKVPSIGIEGNYYPITSSAFIQDLSKRITLITTHAQGAASLNPGELEVMLDRRTLYDDHRGMGEGVVDSKLTRHKFWLLIEDMSLIEFKKKKYHVPSLLANHLSNSIRYPPNIYFVENIDDVKLPNNLKTKLSFLQNNHFPCDLHLLNVRTLTDEQLPLFPSRSALVVLHRQGYDCCIGSGENNFKLCDNNITNIPRLLFNELNIENIHRTSLTGLNKFGSINNFEEIIIDPMDIKTFNLTFKF